MLSRPSAMNHATLIESANGHFRKLPAKYVRDQSIGQVLVAIAHSMTTVLVNSTQKQIQQLNLNFAVCPTCKSMTSL